MEYRDSVYCNYDNTLNSVNPVFFLASITDNEVYNLLEMKKQHDRVHFEEAMVKEMTAMLDNQIIETDPR